VVAQTTILAYFQNKSADSAVVTINVSASERKITDIAKSNLAAVSLLKVNCVASNLQSL
jgi:hypothetical protein